MLEITLITVGDKMPAWVNEGYSDYAQRIRGRIGLKLIEIPAERRGKNADFARIFEKEELKLSQAIPKHSLPIALDRLGKSLSTQQLASKMDHWLSDGVSVSVLVGGPEGLSKDMLSQCHETWSLSDMTFAHPLVRIMVAEQMYRAYSILEGLPYHR